MIEKICNRFSTLPLTAIGYFDSVNDLSLIFDKITSHIDIIYCFICHKGENGDKDHFHIYIESNTTAPLDIKYLLTFFEKEYNGTLKYSIVNGEFRQCKCKHTWWLYSLHDPVYLDSIGEKREFSYTFDNMVSNSSLFIETMKSYKADYFGSMSDIKKLMFLVDNGLSDFEIIDKLRVPLTKIGFVLNTLRYVRGL